MISEHSAHSTSLPVGFRTWLWRYTCFLLLTVVAQASDFRIEKKHIVFLCWIQDSNPVSQTPNRHQTECPLTQRVTNQRYTCLLLLISMLWHLFQCCGAMMRTLKVRAFDILGHTPTLNYHTYLSYQISNATCMRVILDASKFGRIDGGLPQTYDLQYGWYLFLTFFHVTFVTLLQMQTCVNSPIMRPIHDEFKICT